MIEEHSIAIKQTLTAVCTWIDRMPDLPAIIQTKVLSETELIKFPNGLFQSGYGYKYDPMLLSSKEKCIVYLEDWGTRLNGNYDPDKLQLINRFRLICQANLKQFGTAISIDPLMFNIMAAMPKKLQAGSYFTKGVIELVTVQAKTPGIFSRYTFTEKEKQFLMYPYDYFCLEFDLGFVALPDCLPIITTEAIC